MFRNLWPGSRKKANSRLDISLRGLIVPKLHHETQPTVLLPGRSARRLRSLRAMRRRNFAPPALSPIAKTILNVASRINLKRTCIARRALGPECPSRNFGDCGQAGLAQLVEQLICNQ